MNNEKWIPVLNRPDGAFLPASFRVNPTLRHSAWSLFFGGGFLFLSTYAVDQVQVHRCLTCRTLREAKMWVHTGILVDFFLIKNRGVQIYEARVTHILWWIIFHFLLYL